MTRAEKSNYRITSDYDETMRYCRQLEAASNWVRVASYGTSGQGRDLPLVIVSKDRAFTPEQARALGKPIVLIQNGIHSGEIEGKDACLALMRDLAVFKTREGLLDNVTLLVLPILSVDAHERKRRTNRINQNGPEEMGWRTTPIGLNLNRDYLKVETPEMRALISRVYTQWWPHLLVDDHTTDGADYRHDVTYAFNHDAGTPAAISRWLLEAFEGRVIPRVQAMGHLTAPYISFRKDGDPLSGFDFANFPPRFSTGYTPLQCRPGILVETHMLKPYGTRVRATYDLLIGLLEIPLGVLALANPGATLVALITVAGIWAVAIGVMRVVTAFEVKQLPSYVDQAWSDPSHNGVAPAAPQPAPTRA
jgi:murein tripeptide amidase MpaA